MFSFTVCQPTTTLASHLLLSSRLESRLITPPEEFDATMKLREETHNEKGYTPKGDVSRMFPGTYFLESVDEKYRRTYGKVPKKGEAAVNGTH